MQNDDQSNRGCLHFEGCQWKKITGHIHEKLIETYASKTEELHFLDPVSGL